MDKSTSSCGKWRLLFFACLLVFSSCQAQKKQNGISAFKSQTSLTLFAPELALDRNTYKGSFSDDFNTFYFFRKDFSKKDKYLPYITHFKDGRWQKPYLAPYYKEHQSYTYQLNIPHSDQLIFIADLRTKNDVSDHPNYNFWSINKSKLDREQPKELGPQKLIENYNSQPSITQNGTIYFSSLTPDWSKQLSYKMEKQNGAYLEPVLFEPVNQWRSQEDWKVGPFAMAADESFLVVSIQDFNDGNTDLYISFNKNNTWTAPKKLEAGISTPEVEAFPYITADGKYLVFTRAFSQFYIISTSQLF